MGLLLCICQVSLLPAQTPTPTPTQPPLTVYVSDTNFGGILKFNAAGQMTIFASGIGDPTGLAFDNADNLYVSDAQGKTIYKCDPSGSVSVFASGVLLHGPMGLAFDSLGFLYVATAYGDEIIRCDSTGLQNFFAGIGPDFPFGVAFDPSGYLFVSSPNGNTVRKFRTTGYATFFANDLFGPTGLAFDSSGNLYVSNVSSRTIEKFSPAGQGMLFGVTSGDPYGIAFDTTGNLYVAEANNNTIEKFNFTGEGSFFAFGLGHPYAIAVQPSAIPTPAPSILGNLSYCSADPSVPVPNVTLNLTGDASTSTTTDGSGNYQFSTPMTGGSYYVTPTKPALLPWLTTSINTVDVIATQRHFLGLALLSGCRLTAADVNADGSVNTVDVLAIQRFALNMSGFANTGKYRFTPASRDYSGIVSTQTAQDYDVLVLGDVASPFVE